MCVHIFRHLFPVFNATGPLETFQKPSSYRPPEISIPRGLYGSTLSCIVDRNHMDTYNPRLSQVAVSALSQAVSAHLGMEPVAAMRLFDSFAVAPDRRMFYLDDMRQGLPCPLSGWRNSSIKEACSDLDSMDEACTEYCRIVADPRVPGLIPKIRELFERSFPPASIEQPRNPIGLLPTCQRGEGGPVKSTCWRKIVNDRGVCYSSPIGNY